jgi:hypothetical protein
VGVYYGELNNSSILPHVYTQPNQCQGPDHAAPYRDPPHAEISMNILPVGGGQVVSSQVEEGHSLRILSIQSTETFLDTHDNDSARVNEISEVKGDSWTMTFPSSADVECVISVAEVEAHAKLTICGEITGISGSHLEEDDPVFDDGFTTALVVPFGQTWPATVFEETLSEIAPDLPKDCVITIAAQSSSSTAHSLREETPDDREVPSARDEDVDEDIAEPVTGSYGVGFEDVEMQDVWEESVKVAHDLYLRRCTEIDLIRRCTQKKGCRRWMIAKSNQYSFVM